MPLHSNFDAASVYKAKLTCDWFTESRFWMRVYTVARLSSWGVACTVDAASVTWPGKHLLTLTLYLFFWIWKARLKGKHAFKTQFTSVKLVKQKKTFSPVVKLTSDISKSLPNTMGKLKLARCCLTMLNNCGVEEKIFTPITKSKPRTVENNKRHVIVGSHS